MMEIKTTDMINTNEYEELTLDEYDIYLQKRWVAVDDIEKFLLAELGEFEDVDDFIERFRELLKEQGQKS